VSTASIRINHHHHDHPDIAAGLRSAISSALEPAVAIARRHLHEAGEAEAAVHGVPVGRSRSTRSARSTLCWQWWARHWASPTSASTPCTRRRCRSAEAWCTPRTVRSPSGTGVLALRRLARASGDDMGSGS
jgi:hypothetical protein